MKRIRLERWSSQSLNHASRLRPGAAPKQRFIHTCIRGHDRQPQSHSLQSHRNTPARTWQGSSRCYSSSAFAEVIDLHPEEVPRTTRLEDLPSPPLSQSLRSSKLSALHARLGLPRTLPLQTLARCLIHPTADPDPSFNNSALAALGADILGYHTSEHLLCNFPRLPMSVLFAAQNAYVGQRALADIVKHWGVESVAEPGGEVDPGLLQLRRTAPGATALATQDVFEADTTRIDKENAWALGAKRGFGARIVADDQFGDFGRLLKPQQAANKAARSQQSGAERDGPADDELITGGTYPTPPSLESTQDASRLPMTDIETASAAFFRALVGAVTLHAGRAHAKAFHAQHILSRHLDLAPLFVFKYATRDLSRLCAREGFASPVARLLSETGRHSIAPVFIVGVYSGRDKLGEGAGSSLDEARTRAAANALRSWYLYRPVEVTVPSSTEDGLGGGKGKRWLPNYVDAGEVVT